MPCETWKAVLGYPGYEVSDRGRVRSYRSKLIKPWENCGYRYVHLRGGLVNTRESIHRLVLKAFVGPPPKNCDGCHNDGDRANNCLKNLR